MRYIAIGIATAFIVMMGLTLQPDPHATAAIDAQTLYDPGAMYPQVDVNKLPVANDAAAHNMALTADGM